MSRDAKIEARVEGEFKKKLQALADKEERPLSKMIEILLREAIKNRGH